VVISQEKEEEKFEELANTSKTFDKNVKKTIAKPNQKKQ